MHTVEETTQNASKSGKRSTTSTLPKTKKRLKCVLETAVNSERQDDEEIEQITGILDEVRYQPITNEGFHIIAETIRQTLLEITEMKELNLERRHKELMQLLDKHLGTERADKDDYILNQDLQQEEKQQLETIISQQPVEMMNEPNPTLVEEIDLEQMHIKLLPQADYILNQDSKQEEKQQLETIISQQPVEMINEANPTGVEEMALEQVRIKLLPQSVIASAEKAREPQNEFQLMRHNMLAMQRKKMEDRERKKKETLRLAH